MKRLGQCVASITDDEMFVRFMQGLRKSIQREVLEENPSTFGDTCMLAECIGHWGDFVCESEGSNKGYAPMDLDAANDQCR